MPGYSTEACSPAMDVVVLDFETTGLSPARGDRAIEVGAVRIIGGVIAETFSELMNPGFPVSSFITSFTGITNDMLQPAAPCETVMERFSAFLGDSPVVAHNASFDCGFLASEFARIGRAVLPPVACSMRCARRVYPDAPNHKLATLVHHRGIPHDGTFHRALADAMMTARLWLFMLEDIRRQYDLDAPGFGFMQKLMHVPRNQADGFFMQCQKAVFEGQRI